VAHSQKKFLIYVYVPVLGCVVRVMLILLRHCTGVLVTGVNKVHKVVISLKNDLMPVFSVQPRNTVNAMSTC